MPLDSKGLLQSDSTGSSKKNCPIAFMLISHLNLSHLEITKDSFEIYSYRTSKLSLLLNLDPVKAEIFEVKDTRGHI